MYKKCKFCDTTMNKSKVISDYNLQQYKTWKIRKKHEVETVKGLMPLNELQFSQNYVLYYECFYALHVWWNCDW